MTGQDQDKKMEGKGVVWVGGPPTGNDWSGPGQEDGRQGGRLGWGSTHR